MRDNKFKNDIVKNIIVIGTVSFVVLLIMLYSISFLKNKIGNENINQEEIISQEELQTDFESASTEFGKTVEESKNELESNKGNIIEQPKTNKNIEEDKQKKNNNTDDSKKNNNNKKIEEKKSEKKDEEMKQENEPVKFQAPLKGEIIREFATDSLVFSDTLQEWITHNGVDIKADKTSVVTSACDGTIEAIKNDPRYGLTVIISHEDGYKTIYSNLLTAEFVVQGEKVKCGQTIGTVGNSASFEISDTYHLHFELLKDNEYQNPTNFIDF